MPRPRRYMPRRLVRRPPVRSWKDILDKDDAPACRKRLQAWAAVPTAPPHVAAPAAAFWATTWPRLFSRAIVAGAATCLAELVSVSPGPHTRSPVAAGATAQWLRASLDGLPLVLPYSGTPGMYNAALGNDPGIVPASLVLKAIARGGRAAARLGWEDTDPPPAFALGEQALWANPRQARAIAAAIAQGVSQAYGPNRQVSSGHLFSTLGRGIHGQGPDQRRRLTLAVLDALAPFWPTTLPDVARTNSREQEMFMWGARLAKLCPEATRHPVVVAWGQRVAAALSAPDDPHAMMACLQLLHWHRSLAPLPSILPLGPTQAHAMARALNAFIQPPPIAPPDDDAAARLRQAKADRDGADRLVEATRLLRTEGSDPATLKAWWDTLGTQPRWLEIFQDEALDPTVRAALAAHRLDQHLGPGAPPRKSALRF